MENVSHLFLFKGKLQTKSPSAPKMWVPPATLHPMPQIHLSFRTGQQDRDPPISSHPGRLCTTEQLLALVHITQLPATVITNTEKILSL